MAEEVESPGRPVFAYRPALDGLRALAVTGVLLFHGGVRLAVRRVPRRRRVLRAVRLPDHLTAAGRTAPDRPDQTGHVLGAPGPPPAAGPGARADHRRGGVPAATCCRRSSCGLLRGDALAALVYVANWRMIYRGRRLLRADLGPVAAAAHLVARHRGAVLPALAAGRGGRGCSPSAGRRAGRRSGRRAARLLLRAVSLLGALASAVACAAAVPDRQRQPRLLRHRHAGPGAADRVCAGRLLRHPPPEQAQEPPARPGLGRVGHSRDARGGHRRVAVDPRRRYGAGPVPGRADPGRARGRGGDRLRRAGHRPTRGPGARAWPRWSGWGGSPTACTSGTGRCSPFLTTRTHRAERPGPARRCGSALTLAIADPVLRADRGADPARPVALAAASRPATPAACHLRQSVGGRAARGGLVSWRLCRHHPAAGADPGAAAVLAVPTVRRRVTPAPRGDPADPAAGRKPGAQPRIDFFGDSVVVDARHLPARPPRAGRSVTRAIQGCGIALLPDCCSWAGGTNRTPDCARAGRPGTRGVEHRRPGRRR